MPQSVIIATFCRHNVITCPESPDYHFLYVSQHFNSLFVHVHPGLHLETGQSSTTATVHLVFRATIGFLDLHNFICASLPRTFYSLLQCQMLRSVTNSSQSSSLPHLLSVIHDIPHNILLPPARPASQSRAVVLESSYIQRAAVAEKVLHHLSLFTLASLALIRALSPSALRSEVP